MKLRTIQLVQVKNKALIVFFLFMLLSFLVMISTVTIDPSKLYQNSLTGFAILFFNPAV